MLVCSLFARLPRYGPSAAGIVRHRDSARLGPGVHEPAARDSLRHRLIPRRVVKIGLLIRGFGVQVPGGAPVLTWHFYRIFTLVGGRFRAMFAPRLLASRNIVDHGGRAPGETPFRWLYAACYLQVGAPPRSPYAGQDTSGACG